MATRLELAGWDVNAVKGADIEERGAAETWTLVFREQGSGNQIVFAMRREARDELVRQLTGGVVLAGGEFPQLGPR